MEEEEKGSFGGGFVLGFVLGIIGMIICIAINKPKTIKGAVWGFVIWILVLIIFCLPPMCAAFGGY